MATQIFMPALGMAQQTGTLVRWLKAEGDAVREGEAIAEIQTDKAMVELEARASGTMGRLLAHDGQDVPVGQVIGAILATNEKQSTSDGGQAPTAHSSTRGAPVAPPETSSVAEARRGGTYTSGGLNGQAAAPTPASGASAALPEVSPLAFRIANEHGIDVRSVQPAGRRVEKSDVLEHLAARAAHPAHLTDAPSAAAAAPAGARLAPASPKARRLAQEGGIALAAVRGSGPALAVLVSDIEAHRANGSAAVSATTVADVGASSNDTSAALSPIWRVMAERTAQSWRDIPHFFLLRDINASRMIAWRESTQRRHLAGITYTDLLVKVVAQTLRAYPRVNASWQGGGVTLHGDVNVGIAVATDQGLVVPVIHRADTLSLVEIAQRREDIVKRAQAGRQRMDDLTGATFTISNLGMFGVDSFNAIVPTPQAAILAVGRIADRVVPLHGVPAVQPIMALSLSCDHRVIDGARGAQFLSALADLIEEPVGLID